MASYGRAVTGTAVMARSANEEKKKKLDIKLGPRPLEHRDVALLPWKRWNFTSVADSAINTFFLLQRRTSDQALSVIEV